MSLGRVNSMGRIFSKNINMEIFGHKSKPKIGTKCVCTSQDYYLDYVGLDDKKLKQANDVTFLTKALV